MKSGSGSPRFDPGRVSQLQHFHDLMPFRVHDILLVSSLYDSFILAEDGQVSELILSDFLDLNLHHTPGLTRVDNGEAALAHLKEGRPFHLIVTSLHVGDMNALELARRVKRAGHDVPVVVLAYNNRELLEFKRKHDISDIERIFLWQGDVRILLAIVKYIEDKRNVEHDTRSVGVQSIIVIEDNIRFYSSFLPVIYTELVKQTQKVLSEGINVSQKLLRMRARPKILLCDNYEEAWDYFSRYQNDILGVISDIQFPKDGKLSREAGLEFARAAKAARPDLPLMLQSSVPQNRELAESVGADFLLKGSPTLLSDLLRFMKHHFSFGDFVFYLPDGREVGRATDLRSLEKILPKVPAESIAFHAKRDHFSSWLKARTEFSLAQKMRTRKMSHFSDVEAMRQDIIDSIRTYRQERDRGVVAQFDRNLFDASADLYRMGGGSLGGKARGLAFANYMLSTYPMDDRFPDVKVWVPPAVVLGTDVFDNFMEENHLRDFAMSTQDNALIRKRFLEATFPERIAADLDAYLDLIHYPLAVRSSSLLEDSPYLPFAGIYQTYMLPNNEKRRRVRLEQLITAVKLVYASTFSEHARSYLAATPFRLEEEKMAVIIQKIVGSEHGDRFYPDFSGVVRSHNFYPTGRMGPEDGIASVALGLGQTVVEGRACLSFSPRYPRAPVQFASNEDMLNNSQRSFYALELHSRGKGPEAAVASFDLEQAEADGVLGALGSTYSVQDDAIHDGLSRSGPRVVTFAPILKHAEFPLADLLNLLTEMGTWGTGSDVEVEFAVNLSTPAGTPREFGFLQMRPQALADDVVESRLEDVDPARVICRSNRVLGSGKIRALQDLVVVDYKNFDRSRSREAAQEVSRLNAKLVAEGKYYLLLGVGRWGSADPFLGIPVTWDQIAGARVIIEAGFHDLCVTPSQGTHFFHNLTSCNVGYFTVNPESGDGEIDWDWLFRQPALEIGAFFRHIRLPGPLTVLMNGKKQEGVILRPDGLD